MKIPCDVLFWMVGQECMQKKKIIIKNNNYKKKIEKSRKRKKMEKEKEKKTYGLPSRFLLCLFYVFVSFH
jgi:hypothetical protein